jgi:type IV secretory pathway protease TraF
VIRSINVANRRSLIIGLAVVLVCIVISAAATRWQFGISYQRTDSVSRGWYALLAPNNVVIGDLVVANYKDLVKHTPTLSHLKLPHTKILKPVVAISGDWVCLRGDQLFVNQHYLASVFGDGNYQIKHICRWLLADEIYLLSTAHPRSLDSRYFGPVELASIRHKAVHWL